MNILCILDGFGISKDIKGNAINLANKKNIDYIFDKYNMVLGNASGEYVGLPKGQMGNSEVGHLNIGAGRIIYQDISLIFNEIENGNFYKNEEFIKAIENVKKNNSSLHIMGLLSDGGVHSHIQHLYSLLKLAKKENVNKVYIHCFMDGRDTAIDSGYVFAEYLIKEINNIGVGKISTICGRYYAMDRDKNYDRVKLAYDNLTSDIYHKDIDVLQYIKQSYDEKVFDEFIKPASFINDKESFINDKDSIIFYNFRPDRARQITRAFVDKNFSFETTYKKINDLTFVCFTNYDDTIENKYVAFKEKCINNTLGEVVSNNGLKQLRTAETEKYAHVTFFFNGGIEKPYKNEDRVLIPSPKEVPTYDLKPEMSLYGVLDCVLKAINENKYDLIVVNFANPDMVGHTGNLDAAIKAIEYVDDAVGKIYEKIKNTDIIMFICADHGNCECMIDNNGMPHTTHTTNQVPFVLINNKGYKLKENGSLCDIAPTILQLMGIEKPIDMTGNSLLI